MACILPFIELEYSSSAPIPFHCLYPATGICFRSEPQYMTELANEMKDVVPRLSYQAGSGMFPEPCVCKKNFIFLKYVNESLAQISPYRCLAQKLLYKLFAWIFTTDNVN